MVGPADAASLRLASPSRTLAVRAADASRASSAYPFTSGKEKRFWAVPVQQVASQHADRRRSAATPRRLSEPHPTGSLERGGEDLPGEPTPTGSFGSGRDRQLHHRGRISVVRPGAHGFDPGSDSYRGLLGGLSAQCPRKHLSSALSRTQAQGSIGAGSLATAPCYRTSAAEQGLEAGSRQRTQENAIRNCVPG